jgi:hypothetical protein
MHRDVVATLYMAKLNYNIFFFNLKMEGKTTQEDGLVKIYTTVKTKVTTATFRTVKQVYNQHIAHIKNRKHSCMFWLLPLVISREYQY